MRLRNKNILILILFLGCCALTAQSAPAANLENGFTYGMAAGEELKLDLMRGSSAESPLIIWLHGGGWRTGDRSYYHEAMRRFGKLGWAGATVQYRFAPKHKFPAQIDDVRMALAYLRAHAKEYRFDPDRIAVAGGSAGGHLALLLGLAPDKDGKVAPGVRAVVSFAGPTDFRTWRLDAKAEKALQTRVPGGWEQMVGELLGTTDRTAPIMSAASPITHIRKGNPPVLSLQGSADNLCPPQQAALLHAALKRAGVIEKLVVYEGGGHGLDGAHAAQSGLEMIQFLNEHVKQKR